jgi:hypothetical protein
MSKRLFSLLIGLVLLLSLAIFPAPPAVADGTKFLTHREVCR